MIASLPFISFAEAEIFHEFGWSVANFDWNWEIHRFMGGVFGTKESVIRIAALFRESECANNVS